MLRMSAERPARVLITTDAVGGVWRYALDLARGLGSRGVETVLAGFGPVPDSAQRREAEPLADLRWTDCPLDWMVGDPAPLRAIPEVLAALADDCCAQVIHANLPSQAAGLQALQPVVTVAHSCVATWFRTVRNSDLPAGWRWQHRLNAEGMARADAVAAPSRSHAALMAQVYPSLHPADVEVVRNAVAPAQAGLARRPFAYAAARWWDDGKCAAALDEAAGLAHWPVLAFGSTRRPQGQQVRFDDAVVMGQRPHDELREAAATAGIFISPSLYEPFGLAALEAASAGAALVLSDIPTYRELWQDAALFAPAGDGAALAAQVNRLAGDADLRNRLAATAAARAAGFTLARQADAMLSLYARLLDRTELHQTTRRAS